MKNTLLWGLLTGTMTILLTYLADGRSVEVAAPVQANSANVQSDAERHIIELPEDGQAFYLSIFTSPNWQQNAVERRLVMWVNTDTALISLKAQTHFRHFTTDDRLYRARFAAAVQTVPCLMLQNATGQAIYKASGQNLPATPEALVASIRQSITDCCPRPRPTPNPVPDDTQPDPTDKPPLPDIGPGQVSPQTQDVTFLAAIVAVIIASVVGLASEWRKSY